MDRDQTSVRLAHGPLARLRARRAAAAVRPVAPPPAPTAAADDTGPHDLTDLDRLGANLTRCGHDVRISNRTRPGDVPDGAGRLAYVVLEDVVAVLARAAVSDQRVHLRIRSEDGELVVAVQTLPAGDRARPFSPAAHDEAALRRRIEGAAGRATIRTTHGGNWLALVRLPL